MRRRHFMHGHGPHEEWPGHHGAFGPFGPRRRPCRPARPGRGASAAGAGAGAARPGRRPGRDPGPAGRAADARLRDDPGAGGAYRRRLAAEPGSVYPTLQLLEDEDLITGEEGEGRRRFALTDAGRAEAERQDQQAPWEQAVAGVTPSAWSLRDAVGQIVQATWSVAGAGSEAQQAKALEILNDSRRRLYAILAEADRPEADQAEDDQTEA